MGRTPTVIKGGSGGRVASEAPRPFRVDDLLDQARHAMAAARAEAQRLVEAARVEAEAIRRSAWEEARRAGQDEGRREGYDAGRAEALESARREFAEQQGGLVESCRQLIADLDAERAGWLAAGRRDLIDLAMAIARRVAHHVGRRERDVVLANLAEAVRLAGARSELVVQVSPRDAEAARRFAASLVEQQQRCTHVRVVEDEAVSPGGCRVQWASGAADATLEKQLDRIDAELKGQLRAGVQARDEAVDS